MKKPRSIDEIMKEMNDLAKAQGRYLGKAFWEIPSQPGSILDSPDTPESKKRIERLRARRLSKEQRGPIGDSSVSPMSAPRERIAKGSDLEKAVELIEAAILTASHTIKEKAFAIERRKIIIVEGVRHEIDVWVEFDLARGYKSTFIFECKNWEDKVGKNEIIIFSEKIKAAQAQRGFFVARSFTSDAEAQCNSDSRMELLIAKDAPTLFSLIPIPVYVLIMNPTRSHVALDMNVPGDQPKFDDIPCVYRNDVTTIGKCRKAWVDEIMRESRDRILQQVDQANRAGQEGPCAFNAQKLLTFQPGELVIEGRDVPRARVDLEIQTDSMPTRPVFQYEVETRGWCISWEPVRRMTPVIPGIEIGDIGFATPTPLPKSER